MDNGTQTVDRALDVLDLLRRSERPLGIRELARHLDLSGATIHRIVVSLRNRGFVRQSDSRAYELGWAFLEYTNAILARTSLATIATPWARKLRDRTGETVTIQVPSGRDQVCVLEFEALHELRRRVGIGRRTPLYAGASGRSILAFLADSEVADVMASLPPLTEHTVTDPERLAALLAETRSQLVARSFAESVPGISAIAVPILRADGGPVGSLSVSGPNDRWTAEQMDLFEPEVVEAGRAISEQLGFRGDDHELAVATPGGTNQIQERGGT